MFTYPFEMMSTSVDGIIIQKSPDMQKDKLLLIQRKFDPYKDMWALVGGFIEQKELVEDAFLREVKEEVSLELDREEISFFKFVDTPLRDPRQRTISFVYDAYITEEKAKKAIAADDAKELAWFDIRDVIDGKVKLAFDHEKILNEYFTESGYTSYC